MFDKLVDLFIQFLKFFKFTAIIKAYQTGIRLRLGKFHAVLYPGLHFYLPFFIDEILQDNTVIETMRLKPQSVTTTDGTSVIASAVVTFRIEDIKAFFLEIENRNHAIEDVACGAMATFMMKHSWEELVAMEDINNELAKTVRRQAKKYGVDVITMQLVDFTKSPSVRVITGSQPFVLAGS
jgi:regulator of protease activity HflC (stomatin/prohibitin superfamily)